MKYKEIITEKINFSGVVGLWATETFARHLLLMRF